MGLVRRRRRKALRICGDAPAGQLGLGGAYYAANDDALNAAGVFAKQLYFRVGAAPSATGHALRAGRFELFVAHATGGAVTAASHSGRVLLLETTLRR